MTLSKSIAWFFIFIVVSIVILNACSSPKKAGRNYCSEESLVGECVIRKTYRRAVRLFPLN